MKSTSYTCDGCGGTVSVPEYSRKITIEMVRSVHEATCPKGRK
jgi:hypothetical protein